MQKLVDRVLNLFRKAREDADGALDRACCAVRLLAGLLRAASFPVSPVCSRGSRLSTAWRR
jgi:hypothetical protein